MAFMGNSREPSKWRFLVIGCGSIGKRHIENLRRLGVNEIIGFDTQSARLAKVAGGYGIETVASLEAAWEQRPISGYMTITILADQGFSRSRCPFPFVRAVFEPRPEAIFWKQVAIFQMS